MSALDFNPNDMQQWSAHVGVTEDDGYARRLAETLEGWLVFDYDQTSSGVQWSWLVITQVLPFRVIGRISVDRNATRFDRFTVWIPRTDIPEDA